jgi:hypothetical protein
LICYPYQVGYGEGFILNQANLLSQGRSIYQDINNYPYIVSNYPPVYPLLCALFIRILGMSFAIGRTISFIATILIGFLIYIIIKEHSQQEKTLSKKSALIGALFFFASPYIYKYYPLIRVDALALLFSLIGLYFVFKFKNSRYVYFAILFFILAFYAKQIFIAAPIASTVYLIFKDTKKGIIFLVIYSLLAFVIFFIINNATGGQFYLHNIAYNANVFSIFAAIRQYIEMMRVHPIIFLAAISLIVYSIFNKESSLFSIYFIVSAITSLSIGKVGSNLNYFCELIGATCIMLGLFFLRFKINEKNNNIFVLAGFLLQLVLFTHAPFLTYGTPTQNDLDDSKRVSEIIVNMPGPILSENSGLLLVNNKEILFQPFIFTQLAKQNLWNQKPFIKDIEEKKFSLVILTFNTDYENYGEMFSDEVVNAIRYGYHLHQKIGNYYIYRPK